MRKWQRLGAADECIASLMLANCQGLTKAVGGLYGASVVPYSGIVRSLDEALADGGQVEKSCYTQGGFLFLYRSYAPTEPPVRHFPTDQLIAVLEAVTAAYARDILGKRQADVHLDACWAVCQRAGDYGTLHNHTSPAQHDGELYSGMLYLQTPPSINPKTFPNGCLHILTRKEVLYIPPIPQSICLWPAHLVHGIHPFRGPGDRLGVAFNAVVI